MLRFDGTVLLTLSFPAKTGNPDLKLETSLDSGLSLRDPQNDNRNSNLPA